MIQQRKKDYLQRLIEDFFSKFYKLLNEDSSLNIEEKRELLNQSIQFFQTHFDIKQSDEAEVIIYKIRDVTLLEQYSRVQLLKHEIVDIKDIRQLYISSEIIKYVEAADSAYSWERTILRENLLRLLDE